MAIIRKIKNNYDKTIYPITDSSAVFVGQQTLQDYLKGINSTLMGNGALVTLTSDIIASIDTSTGIITNIGNSALQLYSKNFSDTFNGYTDGNFLGNVYSSKTYYVSLSLNINNNSFEYDGYIFSSSFNKGFIKTNAVHIPIGSIYIDYVPSPDGTPTWYMTTSFYPAGTNIFIPTA